MALQKRAPSIYMHTCFVSPKTERVYAAKRESGTSFELKFLAPSFSAAH